MTNEFTSNAATQTSLAGMTAIVTGGGKGLGLGIAKDLALNGCRVALWDLDQAALDAAVTEVSATGSEANPFKVDVSSQDHVERAVQDLVGRTGRIDILVNNAGIAGDQLISKMEVDFWERVLRVNLTSQFICSKAVIPLMVEKKFGRIINISSRAWLGNRGQTAYSSSKGGVVSFTRSLALEFARSGITVNAIAPGIVDTPLFGTLKPDVQEGLKRSVPMQRLGLPEDVANAVRFFALPSSHYVTGQLLYVCGGRSLSSPSV